MATPRLSRTTRAWLASAVLLALAASPVAASQPRAGASTPRPAWGFVTRSGSRLMVNGRPFRFSGPNIYWLGLDENSRTAISYPTPLRVRSALAAAAAMGATVVRSHTLGISVGNPLSIEPALGVFNQTALRHADFAIAEAQRLGIRLIVPLLDDYDYYHGGYHVFTDWLRLSGTRCPSAECARTFYTNPRAISAFEQYVSVILNHVNVYTGVANKDNPTILAWETGNEIRPPREWTSRISTYIKSIDPRHLVEDGYAGIHRADLDLPHVDLFSDHFYPLDTGRLRSDARTVAAARKVFVVGEYAWNDPATLPRFLAAAQSAKALGGDLYWALDGLNDDFGYEQHYDGFQLHLPGDDPDVGGAAPVAAPDSDERLMEELRDHAFAMSGLPVPPFPVPTAPHVTSVEHLPLGNLVEWVGAAAAGSYRVERSAAGAGGPWVTVGSVSGDDAEPWLDRGAPDGRDVWYRVVAVNPNGAPGPPSAAFRLRLRTFVDPLRSLAMAWSHSPGLSIRTARRSLFAGDASRIGSPEGATGRIAWWVPGMRTLEAVGFYGPSPADQPSSDVIQRRGRATGVEGVALPRVLHFQFLISVDGRAWKVVPSRDVALNGGAAAAPGDWTPYVYTIDDVQEVLPGAAYAAVRWGAGSGHIAELGEVRITYAPPA